MRIPLGLCAVGLLMAGTSNASAMSMSFKWCGRPSSRIHFGGVPNGTKTLEFHMIDLDKPRLQSWWRQRFRIRAKRRSSAAP